MTDNQKKEIIKQGLSLLPSNFNGLNAKILLAAIAYQESNFEHRRQIKGPARGLWQFEEGGGVWGVMNHKSSKKLALDLSIMCSVEYKQNAIYNKLEHDDALACAMARLLLWTDPRPLPSNKQDAWNYYIRNWRPGKPHPNRWEDNYTKATRLYLCEN